MKYKRLGNSGLKVSSLCMGTMTFGDGADEAMCRRIYSLCRDRGINFFDCANVYADGKSERILGKLIKQHRDRVVISTKAYYPTSDDINGRGLSRFHLTKALDTSLRNLDTDYVDLYYLHCFDNETPLEESLETLNDFVRRGKVLYLGLSNFAAWQVVKALSLTRQFGYTSISAIQPMYNLLKRQCESELLPMAQSERLGVCTYSPLAGGYLTGKYIREKASEGRFKTNTMYQERYEQERNLTIAEEFLSFAKKNGHHPVSLAIAWAASHPAVSAPILGARNIEQLEPALASEAIEMTAALRNEISELSPAPALPTDREEERNR